MPQVSLHTLGCRLNDYETRLMADRFAAAGYTVVPFGEPADVAVINTCTVTAQADAKCRQAIRGFAQRQPGAFLAVVGCYSQLGYKEIAAIPGVDLILGNHDKLNVIDYVGDGVKNGAPVIVREKISREDFTITVAGERPFAQRANLKIQDGCNFACAFCVIPFARGPARSRDFANLRDEARALAARGVRELVLTGVNIGTYAQGGRRLLDVIDALAEIPGVDRLRLSSIEPTTVPAGALERMADPAHPLLPHLHLPLQSGSDAILRLMRRRYTLADYTAFVRAAVARVPELGLGTDLLVGFPGEGAAEFAETCAYFQQQPFQYGHVFTYSERADTLAAKRPDRVAFAERRRRSAHLRRLSAQKRHAWLTAMVGREVVALFEDSREGAWPGLTDHYARVVVPQSSAPHPLANRRARVRLTGVAADFLEAEWLQTLD